MTSRSGLSTLLALAVVLAGCASGAETAPAETPAARVITVTEADDISSLENMTLNNESHYHDYWGGLDHLVVMETTVRSVKLFISPEGVFEYYPEAGKVVPQGASSVDVAMSWTNEATDQYSDPELWVKTAADADAFLVGPLVQGEALRISTLLPQADLPHQSLSAWRFEFRMGPGPGGLIRFDGDVTIKVEAHRGLDIPLYPPHPDLWDGREAIELLDAGQNFGIWHGSPDVGSNCFGQCAAIWHPDNGTIVPYDGDHVEVRLERGGDSVDTLGLSFHGADTRAWTRLTPESDEGGVRTYLIPIEAAMGDGPYATQSQWEFTFHIEGPLRDEWHIGSYAIAARVVR